MSDTVERTVKRASTTLSSVASTDGAPSQVGLGQSGGAGFTSAPLGDQTPSPASDTVAPYLISITRVGTEERTSAEDLQYIVTFSEAVTGVSVEDFSIVHIPGIGATREVVKVEGSGDRYIVTIKNTTLIGSSYIEPNMAATDIKDAAGNPLVAATYTSESYRKVLAASVRGVYGIDGFYKAGDQVKIGVSLTSPITVTGDGLELLLETGAVERVATFSGVEDDWLNFTYTVQPGDSTFDLDYASPDALRLLPGSTVKDRDGSDAILTLALPGAERSLSFNQNIAIGRAVPPALDQVEANSGRIFMNFDRALDQASVPGKSAFTVLVDGQPATIGNVTVVTRSVVLDLVEPVRHGQTVQLAYQDPTDGDDAGVIQEINGSDADSIALATIPNATPDVTAPTVTSITLPPAGRYKAGDVLTFTATLSEPVSYMATETAFKFAGPAAADTLYGDYVPSLDVRIGSKTVRVYQETPTTWVDDQRYVEDVAFFNDVTTIRYSYTVQPGDLSGADQPAGLSVVGIGNGAVTIKDAGNNTMEPPTVPDTIIGSGVAVDAVAPTITAITLPPDDVYANNRAVVFYIHFSEEVTLYGTSSADTPYLTLEVGGQTCYAEGSYLGTGTVLQLAYLPWKSDENDLDGITVTGLTIKPGLIRDHAGNILDATLPPGIGHMPNVLLDYGAARQVEVTAPPAGTYKAGDHLDFAVNYERPVIVTGTDSTLEFTLGNRILQAAYLRTEGSDVIYRYTVQPGDAAANGLSIEGVVRNNSVFTDAADPSRLASTRRPPWGMDASKVLVDGVAPTVTSIQRDNPAETVTNADSLSWLVSFDKAMTNIGTDDFAVTGSTATVQSVALVSGNTYRVTVSGGDLAGANGPVTLGFAPGRDLTDAAGNALSSTTPTGTSDPTYTLDNTGPAILEVTPPAATIYRPDDILTITVRFDATVTVDGTPRLPLAVGGGGPTVYAVYTGGSGTDTLTFAYTVAVGVDDGDGVEPGAIDLHGGTILDAIGNPAELDLADADFSGVIIDAGAPTVLGVGAGNPTGTHKAGDSFNLTVRFSKPVDVTGTPTLTLTTGGAATYTGGDGTDTLAFTYTVQPGDTTTDLDCASDGALSLADGTITGTVSGQPATLTLPAPGSPGSLGANASIVLDTTAPTITGVTLPADGVYAAGDALDVVVRFSEAVTLTGTPTVALTLDTGGTVQAACVSGNGTDTLTFRHVVVAGDQDGDGVEIAGSLGLGGGAITDRAGNALAAGDFPAGSGGVKPGITVEGTANRVTGVGAATADGAYKAGDVVTLQVVFAKAVSVTGTPTLTLATGHAATYAGGTGTDTLTFTYTVQPGDTAADLDYAAADALALAGGTITDTLFGTNVGLALPVPGGAGSLGAKAALVLDTSPPEAPHAGTAAGDGTVNGAEAAAGVTLTGTVAPDVTGLDLIVAGQTRAATLTGTAQTGISWTVTLTGADIAALGQGAKSLTLTARDAAGNSTDATVAFTIDTLIAPPTAIMPARVPAGAAAVPYTVTFAEDVTGVDAADFMLTATGSASGAIAGVTAVDARTYTVLVDGITGAGTLRLDLKGSGTGIADRAGNPVAGGFTGGAVHTVDHVGPTLGGAVVNGATLVLTYDEALDGASDPAGSAYAVLVDGLTVPVVAANADGRTVTLSLAHPVANGQAVTVAYVPPGTSPVRDTVGNAAGALTARPVTNATPLPGPTDPGTPPTDPNTPTTDIVDGVPVETKVESDGTGRLVHVVTVPTVPATRPDGAPVASIEVALVKGGDGAPLLAAELPAGFGLRVEGPTGGPQTPQQALADLTKVLDARSGDDGMADLASGFLNGLPADSRIVLRTIVPSVPPGTTQAPGQPLVISAPAGGTGTQEVLVLDLRSLPPGTVIGLQNVEFAVILGDARVTGGAGSQTAVGGGGKQYIVLGADDDVLHGGAGNDVVGSQGGNDRISGDEGNDTLDGGTGVDVVRFAGRATDFATTVNTDGTVSVTDQRVYATVVGIAPGEGTDTLTSVELVRFDDGVRLAVVPDAPMTTFDEALYLRLSPDVAKAVNDGIFLSGQQHFEQFGAAEGRGTLLTVDEAFYRAQNPDVDAAIRSGQFASAAEHFALHGLKEGRDPSAFFATSWYLAENTDVAKAVQAGQTTAYQHYSQHGWKEGRDASVWFDTSEYLAHNADVAAAGVNPLSQLLDFGLREGRLAYANDTGLWG